MDLAMQIECLQEAIYHESRSESVAGQLAVGLVVMNRVMDKRWPDNTCDVVHQKWQFSYYYDGKAEVYHDNRAKQLAGVLAEQVFFGTVIDFTENSLYYHTQQVVPDWDYSKIQRVLSLDNHIFYRDVKRRIK